MTGLPQAGRRPVLAVPHGFRSIPFLELAAAAEPLCDLVWLVRSDDPEVVATGRVLRRLGPVVDLVGLDPDAAAAAVAEHRPSGVVAFRDEDLVPMAALAERLGLPFHTPAVARRLADKWEQRQALRAGGLPVPAVWELPAARDAGTVAAVARRVAYPAVVKPRCGSGSRYTFLVQSRSELLVAARWLDGTPGGAEPMIVEEYLASRPGAECRPFADYVSVETLADGDRLHHLAVTGRLHQTASFRETGFFMPSDLGRDEREAVLSAATAALVALGVRIGCVHTELKLTPDGPRVIEVNGRMGGGVAEMLSVTTGTDLLPLILRVALGERIRIDGPSAIDDPAAGRGIGYRLFLQPPLSARRVRAIDGLQEVSALTGVDTVSVHFSPGDQLDPLQGTRAFVLGVVGAARDHAEVLNVNRRMYELAAVSYDHVPGVVGPGMEPVATPAAIPAISPVAASVAGAVA